MRELVLVFCIPLCSFAKHFQRGQNDVMDTWIHGWNINDHVTMALSLERIGALTKFSCFACRSCTLKRFRLIVLIRLIKSSRCQHEI